MEPKSPEDEKIAESFRQTRKSLIERLHDWEGNQRSWDDFYQTYWRLIFSVALKSGLRREEAFDVVQETIISIAKQSKRNLFDPDKGSFKSWLLNAARWRIADQFRKRAKDTASPGMPGEDGEDYDALSKIADPKGDALERLWEIEWKTHISDIAVDKVKARVSPKQFQIFHCHVVQGWGVRKVASALGVNAAQVYLAKHRIGSQVKKEISALENKFV